MFNDFRDKVVLITGGVQGVGLSTGMAFAEQGAKCVLTYKWDRSKEELDRIRDKFVSQGYEEPLCVQSDVTKQEDIDHLMQQLRAYGDGVEVFLSKVAFGPTTRSFDDYTERSLFRAIEYSAWPLVSFTKALKKTFGRYPRYVIGLSSFGVDVYHSNYDLTAASKALLETMLRYLNYRLKEEGVAVNIVRLGYVKTASAQATYGEAFAGFVDKYNVADFVLEAREVADVILALCSGLMDGISGQVIKVDRGANFLDNLLLYYEKRHELGM